MSARRVFSHQSHECYKRSVMSISNVLHTYVDCVNCQVMNNPALIRQVMENPMVQQIMSNPEIMRQMMLSNPQMRDLMEVGSAVGNQH